MHGRIELHRDLLLEYRQLNHLKATLPTTPCHHAGEFCTGKQCSYFHIQFIKALSEHAVMHHVQYANSSACTKADLLTDRQTLATMHHFFHCLIDLCVAMETL